MRFSIAILVAALFSLSCGGPGERIKDINASRSSTTPTPSEREISGTFKVNGSFTNESDPYEGILAIVPQDDIYSFRWTTSRGSRVGVGFSSEM